jgi:hypothetical protein
LAGRERAPLRQTYASRLNGEIASRLDGGCCAGRSMCVVR